MIKFIPSEQYKTRLDQYEFYSIKEMIAFILENLWSRDHIHISLDYDTKKLQVFLQCSGNCDIWYEIIGEIEE